jgi:IS30 family transposase
MEAGTMRITMIDRRALAKLKCERYRKARKKEKGRILDEFVEEAHCSRDHARWLLRNHGRRVEVKPLVFVEGDARQRRPRHRKKIYGPEVVAPLKRIWEILDCICGKLLAAAIPEVMPKLVECGELKVRKSVEKKLLAMSASTIDRILKPEREKYRFKKRRGGTKPGTLLKSQIPVRTFADWDEQEPGFFEMDLVAHEGGNASGDFCHTLDLTDVHTGWTVQRAVLNKAEKWTFEALQQLRAELPFPLKGLDSDNGGEFINHNLYRYCTDEKISFTRARPHRKNDNCYVEQKNWSVVRRFVGYGRYEGQGACDILNQLYRVLHDYINFFVPTMKLKEKIQTGGHCLRRYSAPQTPFQRVLAALEVDAATKQRLRRYYRRLNPAQLRRQIEALQKKLTSLARRNAQTQETAA